MRKVWLTFIGLLLCIDGVNAAVRDANTISRQSTRNDNAVTTRSTQKRTVSARTTGTSNRVTPNARSSINKTVIGRSATKPITVRYATQPTRISRAAATTVATRTFGTNYNSCRDAYFTCMDQFCAVQNENYRRCVCSSKLQDIQNQEKLLSQTSNSLQDFEDLNIDMISKTSAETKAMLSATSGESAIKEDSSVANNTLKNISNVLSNTKKQSLSTAGQLDIAGNIKSIWSTTDLMVGSDLANLTGEALFNAVHKQCVELVTDSCVSSDLKMVSSAYGMYVENDCAILQNNLDLKTNAANAAIRSTRHKMQDARLENYDAHNSLTINDCIAKVREDILADTACGEGFVHCLDFSGKYLNVTTGEAIYSPDFYQIENQLSLSGDVLSNSANVSFITMLNKKRVFAQKDLDSCQDNADDVWNEFLRQALVEIYQAQQQRVQTVKNECLQVINECYLKKSDTLKQFADTTSPITFVQTLELSEEMCNDKLNTCSNLYGGGSDGLEILIATMTGITDLAIEQSCTDLLTRFAQSVCAVPISDSSHAYPYGCRKYAPGEGRYARTEICNTTLTNPFSRSDIITTNVVTPTFANYDNACKQLTKRYSECRFNYYLYNYEDCNKDYCFNESNATECHPCPKQCICYGGKQAPISRDSNLYEQCGLYYIGSLYQQLVIYALQNCTRTSDSSNVLSEALLSAVNQTVQNVKSALIPMLSKECSDLNGVWVNSAWVDDNNNGYHDTTGDVLLKSFYVTTGTSTLWGYCKDPT